jgi:putative ABC transport system permease protein
VAVAALAVAVASAVVVCGLGLSLGIRQKLGHELRAYGANVIVSPGEDTYIEQNILDAISGVEGVKDLSPQLYVSVSVSDVPVELIGMDLTGAAGWRLEGTLPRNEREVLLGARLSDALGLAAGEELMLSYENKRHRVSVSGMAERGGPEDGAVMMPLEAAQAISGLSGKLSAVLLRVDTSDFESTVSALTEGFPALTVKTLRQVAHAEESFLRKIELLMFLVGTVVLVATSISVTSTMSATVLERMKEIGLMRAIGGTRREIRRFYLAEGSVIGIVGGLIGFVAGAGAAEAVSRGAFGSFVSVPFYLVFLALGLGVLISMGASMGPLAGAMREHPAVVLRGE